jgi:hypothetical protein
VAAAAGAQLQPLLRHTAGQRPPRPLPQGASAKQVAAAECAAQLQELAVEGARLCQGVPVYSALEYPQVVLLQQQEMQLRCTGGLPMAVEQRPLPELPQQEVAVVRPQLGDVPHTPAATHRRQAAEPAGSKSTGAAAVEGLAGGSNGGGRRPSACSSSAGGIPATAAHAGTSIGTVGDGSSAAPAHLHEQQQREPDSPSVQGAGLPDASHAGAAPAALAAHPSVGVGGAGFDGGVDGCEGEGAVCSEGSGPARVGAGGGAAVLPGHTVPAAAVVGGQLGDTGLNSIPELEGLDVRSSRDG